MEEEGGCPYDERNINNGMEVMLNKQQGNMYPWVTSTWNVIKGKCPHDCSYCHPAKTKIMMSDYTQKSIEKVKIGDEIIGIQKLNNEGYSKFVKSKVIDISKRKSNTLKIITPDGELICTPEHPLFGSTEKRNGVDWKSAKAYSPYEHLRYISNNEIGDYSTEHRLGYIKGIRDGDGCVFKTGNKEGNEYLGFEIVGIDKKLEEKIKNDFKEVLNINLKNGIKRVSKKSFGNNTPMLHTRVFEDVKKLEAKTKFRLNKEFAKGYIAGMFDTDGSIGKNQVIRISQSKIVNKNKYDNLLNCCKLLGLKYIEEKMGIRLYSNFLVRIRFLIDFGVYHSTKRERFLINSSTKGSLRSQIQSISIHQNVTVYNLQTECENFIANGFIVHNCYMKRFPQKPIRLDEGEFNTDLGEDNIIFVGSSCDMFAREIPSDWIRRVIEHCKEYPSNTYLFQSKNPMRFGEFVLPKKSIIGTTIESDREYNLSEAPSVVNRYITMKQYKMKKMVSIEPILDFDSLILVKWIRDINPEFVSVGADSKGHDLDEPKDFIKINNFLEELKEFTEVRTKNNLKRLMQ